MENNPTPGPTSAQTPQVPATEPTQTPQPTPTPTPKLPQPSKYLSYQELQDLKSFVKQFDDASFKERFDKSDFRIYMHQSEKTIELFRDIFSYDRYVRRVLYQDVNRAENWPIESLHTLFISAVGKGSEHMNELIDQYDNGQKQFLQRQVDSMTLQELAIALPFLNSVKY